MLTWVLDAKREGQKSVKPDIPDHAISKEIYLSSWLIESLISVELTIKNN
jgi:hypothetical protein